jgi:hypothetical protein
MPSWSFQGQTFDVVADSPIFEEWFASKTERTIDVVLSGSGTPRRYVDIGGVAIQPLTFIMQFKGAGAIADRTTMKGYRGTVGTLEDDDGRTCQALLADVVDIRVIRPDSGYVRLGVTFEYVGAT